VERPPSDKRPPAGVGFRIKEAIEGSLSDTSFERQLHTGEHYIVGRSKKADIVIEDDSISRRHAEIRRTDQGWLLTDAGSVNGVWIGDHKVQEHLLQDQTEFSLGKVKLRFEIEPTPPGPPAGGKTTAASPPPQQPSPPSRQRLPEGALPPVAAPLRHDQTAVAQVFISEGTAIAASGNRPFLLDDSETVWYVETGKLELFTVAVKDNEATGARSHFISSGKGDLLFGMDFEQYDMGSGILAVGVIGTQLRQLRVTRLQQLATDQRYAFEVAAMVNAWVARLSRSLTEEIIPGPLVTHTLEPGRELTLQSREKARSSRDVLWVEVLDGNLLFIGMEELLFSGQTDAGRPKRHSTKIKVRELLELARRSVQRRSLLFPVTPDTWIEACNPADEHTRVTVQTADVLVGEVDFWESLQLFHRVLCQCEFINKRLEAVDEFNRLKTKAEYSQAAREAALREIAAVMEPARATAITGAEQDERDPLMAAATMVGQAMGITIHSHPELERVTSFEDRVAAIAKASRIRFRRVALRDDWWRHDQGPLLALSDASQQPVALLPRGATSYRCVDPVTQSSVIIDEELAATLVPFAFTLYRRFPDGPLKILDLFKFGLSNLAKDLWMLAAMGVALGLLGTLTPHFTGKIFDTAIPEADKGVLLQFTSALFLAAVIAAAFKITQSIATLRIQGKMDYSLQAAVWDRLLNLPSTFFRQFSAGDLADRAGGISTIRGMLAGAGISSILGALSAVFYLGLMMLYDISMTMVAVGLTAVFVGCTTIGNYLQLRYQRQTLEVQGKITGLVLQLVAGIGKIRVAGAENHAFRVWARVFASQRRLEFRIGKIQNVVEVFNSGFSLFASMAIFFALISLLGNDTGSPAMSTGEFIAFASAFGAFLAAAQSLSGASLTSLWIIPVYERLAPIISNDAEVDETKAYPGTLKGHIDISHVSFRYSDDTPLILNDFSLEIKPGEFVALVGESGCGKSTLMRLMLGFEIQEKGSIYYDGQDLANLDLREVRQQMGVVLQNSELLPADIFRNIVGTSSLTIDDAWEAARVAGLEEDIKEMPMQMHTYVSEGGGGLSGGQRQRLLIARAMVRKPRILFLDEATSALDNRAQAIVTQSMENLQATRIVIAHRLSTIIKADKIVYIAHGKIAEKGTFEELMERNGLFADLARRQMV